MLLSIIAIYLLIGAAIAAWTWEPEQGGWVWVILLWPLQLLARIVG